MDAFTVENGVLTRYTGEDAQVIIPDGVTEIARYAFLGGRALRQVAIPASVTAIGDYAFANCEALTGLCLPDGLRTVGKEAFRGCASLTALHIPATLTEIGLGAFGGCFSLAQITCDVQNPRFSAQGNCLVEKKTRTLVLGCSRSSIPTDIRAIGALAFWGAKHLNMLTLPLGVKHIGDGAFRDCLWLRSAVVPPSVQTMGRGVFIGTPLSQLVIPFVGSRRDGKGDNRLGVLFTERGDNIDIPIWLKCVTVTGSAPIPPRAFAHCRHLRTILLSPRTKRIGYGAFAGCTSLVELSAPYRLLPHLSASARQSALLGYLSHKNRADRLSASAHRAYRTLLATEADKLLPRIAADSDRLHAFLSLGLLRPDRFSLAKRLVTRGGNMACDALLSRFL